MNVKTAASMNARLDDPVAPSNKPFLKDNLSYRMAIVRPRKHGLQSKTYSWIMLLRFLRTIKVHRKYTGSPHRIFRGNSPARYTFLPSEEITMKFIQKEAFLLVLKKPFVG